jgi:hypothetical protein
MLFTKHGADHIKKDEMGRAEMRNALTEKSEGNKLFKRPRI